MVCEQQKASTQPARGAWTGRCAHRAPWSLESSPASILVHWEARFGGFHFSPFLPAMTAHFLHTQEVGQVEGILSRTCEFSSP